jgi:hypothetical protein
MPGQASSQLVDANHIACGSGRLQKCGPEVIRTNVIHNLYEACCFRENRLANTLFDTPILRSCGVGAPSFVTKLPHSKFI